MNSPLVSIIIPIYNSEKYLPKTISSCMNQSYDNIEIILVDDGSVDSSLTICNRFAEADKRIKVIHQDNAGVSAARNTGMRCAIGEYVFFLDSDDEIYPNSIEILVNDMMQFDADIVSAVYSNVTVDGREYCNYNDGEIMVYEGTEPIILSLKYDRQTNAAWAKLFSKKIIDGIFFVEDRKINEDGYFVFQCYAKRPRLVQHNEIVYKYFTRAESSTRGVFSEKYFDMIYFSDLKMAYIKENYPHLTELARDMEVSTHIFLLDALCRDTEYKYMDAAKKSISLVRKRFWKYRSINRHEHKMSWIVALGLYPIYKKMIQAKYFK